MKKELTKGCGLLRRARTAPNHYQKETKMRERRGGERARTERDVAQREEARGEG